MISIFNEQELELLISGLPNVDIEDLKTNTEYHKYQSNSLQVNNKTFEISTMLITVNYRYNGFGEHYDRSIKPIGLSSYNLSLAHLKFLFKGLAH